MSMRANGKNSLQKVIKNPKNIDIIENNIHKICSDFDDYEQKYKEYIYQVIGDTLNKVPLKTILENIKNKNVGWNHSCFQTFKAIMEEQEEFIENPFEVVEGAMECQKCKSKRVFYYQKQSRSCDEGFNTYASCCNCNAKWTIRG
jgi:DNA-directed RNA polymerase subunit M/transcription elongation factor TFIIS